RFPDRDGLAPLWIWRRPEGHLSRSRLMLMPEGTRPVRGTDAWSRSVPRTGCWRADWEYVEAFDSTRSATKNVSGPLAAAFPPAAACTSKERSAAANRMPSAAGVSGYE